MHEGIYIAASGAFKQEHKLDVIANNLANMGTTAFKRDGMAFRELIPPFNETAQLSASLDPKPTAFQPDPNVSYVGVADMYTDVSNGTSRRTGNTFDLALDGKGFFVVDAPQGQRYTRNGNFQLSGNGTLITHDGYKVLDREGKPIKIDTQVTDISINSGGGIAVGKDDESIPAGDLQLVDFDDPSKLAKEGNGFFKIADPSVKKQPAQKAYQKIIQSIDEADEQAVNAIGRLA
jgi:flagellar basal-body rod protein FlgG